jgi:acetyl esterase/lipase
LRSFENAWERQADGAARKRTIEPLIAATRAFFSLRHGEAGRALDQARFALQSDQAPVAETQWATSLHVAVSRRLLDVRQRKLDVTLQPFYKVESTTPPKAELRLRLVAQDGARELAALTQPIGDLFPQQACLEWKEIPTGDHSLRIEILVDGHVQAATEQTVSLENDIAQRLTVLQKMPHEDAFRTIEAQTFGELRRILVALEDGKTLETNYPAARLLTELETLPDVIRRGAEHYASPKAGQFWLRVVAGTSKETVRVFVPDQLKKDQLVPLVVALHGAGGSENMFFDGYGNGKIVRLCQERGWILVAPRLSPFAAGMKTDSLVAELAKRWPIDPKRVFVVGHSMGALLAVQAAKAAPEKIAAVAALGGGQKVDAAPLVNVPFFIGVGSHDFLLRNVKTLHDSLSEAEVKTVIYREYPDLEHLVIVQEALPEVFTFFDGVAKKK